MQSREIKWKFENQVKFQQEDLADGSHVILLSHIL